MWEAGCVDISPCLQRHHDAPPEGDPSDPSERRDGGDCSDHPPDGDAHDQMDELLEVDAGRPRARKSRNCVPLSTRKECRSKVRRCPLKSYPFTDRDWTKLADSAVMVCSDQPAVLMIRLAVHDAGHETPSDLNDNLHFDQQFIHNEIKVLAYSEPPILSLPSVTPMHSPRFRNFVSQPVRENARYPFGFNQRATILQRFDSSSRKEIPATPDSLLTSSTPFIKTTLSYPLASITPTLPSLHDQPASGQTSSSVVPALSPLQAQSVREHISASVVPALSSPQVQPATRHHLSSLHTQPESHYSADRGQWKTRSQLIELSASIPSSPSEALSTLNLLPPRDSSLLQMLPSRSTFTTSTSTTAIPKFVGSWYQRHSTPPSWGPPSADGAAQQTKPTHDTAFPSTALLPSLAAPYREVSSYRVPLLRSRANLRTTSPPFVNSDQMVNISVQFPIKATSHFHNSSTAYDVTLKIISSILSAINATVDDLLCLDRSSNKDNLSLPVKSPENDSFSVMLQENSNLPVTTQGSISNMQSISPRTTNIPKPYSHNMLHNLPNDTESASEYFQISTSNSSFDERFNFIPLNENEDDNAILPQIDERYRYHVHHISGPNKSGNHLSKLNFSGDNSLRTENIYTSDDGKVKVVSKREALFQTEKRNSYEIAPTYYSHSVMTKTNNISEYGKGDENPSLIVDMSTYVDLSGVSSNDRGKYAYNVAGNSDSRDDKAHRTYPPPEANNTLPPGATVDTREQLTHNSYLLSKRVCLNISIADPQQMHNNITIRVLIRERKPDAEDIRQSQRPRSGAHSLGSADSGRKDGQGSAPQAEQASDGARGGDSRVPMATERTISRNLQLPAHPYRGSSIHTLVCF